MKKLLFILTLFLVTSCTTKYTNIVEVTYSDNSIDTISVVTESSQTIIMCIPLNGGCLHNDASVNSRGMYINPIVCTVKNFKVLSRYEIEEK